jgi:hypothetical protein
MGYSTESPLHCLDQIGNSAGTLEYFKSQVPDGHLRFPFRWYKNGNSRMSHRYWVSSNGEESVDWFFQAYVATLAEEHITMKYAGGGLRQWTCLFQIPSLFNWCSSLFPGTFRLFMLIRTLSQKIGMLRNCLPCAVKKRIDSMPPMEVSLSSMFSRKTRTIRTIRNFSHLVQIRRNMIRMPPHKRMLLRNANELMQSRRNYGTDI